MLARWWTAIVLALAGALPASVAAEEAYLRVVDVGPGLCVVASVPGGYHLLYDAGHWQSSQCATAVSELVEDDTIELIVLSHSDSDHLGELPAILGRKKAGVILHTASPRPDTAAWRNAMNAIADQVKDGATVLSLKSWPLPNGAQFQLGGATVTFIAGWHEWPLGLSDPGRLPDASELRNVISIVMRFEYGGRSVLLTGDTIGRRRNDGPEACRDAERWMVEGPLGVSVRSDVLVAPHHGGNNGSSSCFIQAVAPSYVVFAAGHGHGHPHGHAAERYLTLGVPPERLFRTDRGDDEGGSEWPFGRISGCRDRRGDDDVEIRLPSDPRMELHVGYRQPQGAC